MSKLMIIDGNSIINRAFYAIRNLTAPDGLNTNGIYGFLNIMLKNLDAEKPDFVAVAFDLKAPTFRHLKYELYKANRKGMPDELAEQMPVLKDVLRAMNISVLELEGYEADDIIGTIAQRCVNDGIECRILTGDRDDLQLATDKVLVLLTTTAKGQTETKIFDREAVREAYGIEPSALIDAKGLMGDSSDNVPGVSGVGEKTAMTLIGKYGSIENLYEHIDDGDIKGALLEKLKKGRNMAFLSRELVTIDKNVPLEFAAEDFCTKEYNREDLSAIFKRLGFESFIKRLGLDEIHAEPLFAEALPFCECTDVGEKVYFHIYDNNVYLCFGKEVYTASFNEAKEIFENSEVKKCGHDIKNDIVLLHSLGIQFNGVGFDTALAVYLLNPARTSYGFESICEEYLGQVPNEGGAGAILAPLTETLLKNLEEKDLKDLYFNIELPLAAILADMQIAGILVDKKMLSELSLQFESHIKYLEESIYALAGQEFNINSTKQLGVVLFESLGLPPVKKTKTGYSTDVDVLNKLRSRHPIIDHILDYRQLAKLKSTYADGLANFINQVTNRIHSSFNQTVTTTGRLSSADPNLQNIPVRTEIGRELRRVFVTDHDHVLVDADYSQIELRVLAHISEDSSMKEAFRNNDDIHTKTAAQVFGVADFMVTPQMRSSAKAVNFGIVYGISEFSLAEDIGVSRKEAKVYIENYLNTYSGVREFMKNSVAFAKEHGYVKTLLQRRRYIPEITASNFNLRSFGERVAMNAPIQGSAADIIKIAMIRVYNSLKEKAPKSKLILQVHDELIVEAHIDETEKVKEILKYEMENAFPLSVPLTVDLNTGTSWYDAK